LTRPGEYPYYCILHADGPEAEGGMTSIIIEA
jgi:plastocyanin